MGWFYIGITISKSVRFILIINIYLKGDYVRLIVLFFIMCFIMIPIYYWLRKRFGDSLKGE